MKLIEKVHSSTESFYAVLGALALLIGGIMWLSHLAYETNANAKDLESVKSLESLHTSQFQEIRERLVRIEDKMGE